ncbi:MAG: site-specific DNA-methyltransferase [Tannerellaceae bacterium]|jgi:DNA modification methylase|nr:site-specific DNA-methyltransferase [Tannerellaceae bacterium]
MTGSLNRIYTGDAKEVLATLPDSSVDCCVTSPPYFGLRDYHVDGQIGLESTTRAYVERLLDVFNQVYRVLKTEGTLWLNIGDSYAGSGRGKGGINRSMQPKASSTGYLFDKPYRLEGCKNKDLIGIPWMLAFALRSSGWYLRQEIIWHKPNAMPESVTDRCTKSHESLFLLSKSPKYYYDHRAIMEPAKYDGRRDTVAKDSPKYSQVSDDPTHNFARRAHERWPNMAHGYPARNRRDVWRVPTRPFRGAHFATFPPELIEPCILAGCPAGGVVIDPFFGSGTTGVVARILGRNYIGIDLNAEYIQIAEERLRRSAAI